MKKLLALSLICFFLSPVLSTQAKEPTLLPGYATAYKECGTMSSSQETRPGVCAGAEKYAGCMVVLYQRLPDGSLGDYIGMYECLDTGITDGIKEGKVIDVWQPDLEACQDFADITYANGCDGKVYIQIIEGEG